MPIHAQFCRPAIWSRKVGQSVNLVTAHCRSAASRDTANKYFCDRLQPTKVGRGDLLYQGSLVGQCMQDYKSVYTAVTICATLFVPKFDLSILTSVTSKSRSNPRHFLHHVRYTHDPNLVPAELASWAKHYYVM